MKPFISTKFYGFLNYVVAITLMASPWLFNFYHVGGASFFLPLVFGWLQLIMAIFSKHELGFIKIFPVSMHCFIDVVGGSFLLASPFVYGYSGEVYLPQLLLGSLVFFLGIFTRTSPFTDEPQHVFRDGLSNTTDLDEPMAH
ncbi:MAG: SPW repeat domain-containing protein [Mucilaginibacter sp.]